MALASKITATVFLSRTTGALTQNQLQSASSTAYSDRLLWVSGLREHHRVLTRISQPQEVSGTGMFTGSSNWKDYSTRLHVEKWLPPRVVTCSGGNGLRKKKDDPILPFHTLRTTRKRMGASHAYFNLE
ncbi:hypothetical protein EDC04DRAFT_1554717 [Pisolithus marmoratus]|nr:hypothetical protein EDC04DRAFT_1554717 [Pisolithus marmoratus]